MSPFQSRGGNPARLCTAAAICIRQRLQGIAQQLRLQPRAKALQLQGGWFRPDRRGHGKPQQMLQGRESAACILILMGAPPAACFNAPACGGCP